MKIPSLLTAVLFLALPLFPLLYAAEPASIPKASSSIAAVPVPTREFKDGDTVCFVGDSITKGGDYQTLIESFYAAKFPERRIRCVSFPKLSEASLGTPPLPATLLLHRAAPPGCSLGGSARDGLWWFGQLGD